MLFFSSNSRNERGQGLVEYAIILALVAIVVIGAMRILGPQISCAFSTINSSLPGESGDSTEACGSSLSSTSSGLATKFTSTFTGCSGTCTDTTFTCTPGSSYKISYTASSYGGETGSSPGHACSGGGTAFAGNFFPEQEVTITDEVTGESQSYTVTHP